jgi:hypothetical protein
MSRDRTKLRAFQLADALVIDIWACAGLGTPVHGLNTQSQKPKP